MFALDPRLASDTRHVSDLALSAVRLMDDRRFPWLILVPRRAGAVELVDLVEADRLVLLEEISLVSRVLQRAFAPDKLNVAALGNLVPQLHVHVIARFRADPAWPRPVWGVGEPAPYGEVEGGERAGRLAEAIAGG
ncbi:MAG: HIT domain-containing protein [Rhizobiales bacterium]|nr:HIT domain-containing protein [Hyphomicrobiales bacterium]